MNVKLKFSFVLLLLMFLITGCVTEVGDVIKTTESMELNAEKADVEIKMGAGVLSISDNSSNLLDADFFYNIKEWKPIVNYIEGEDKDLLTIVQPSAFEQNPVVLVYEWDLNFNNDIEMDMKISLSAGQCQANLGNLNLKTLDLKLGAGEATVNLVGEWRQDLSAVISGGVGSATIVLPKDTGVRVIVSDIIGSIEKTGLRKDGDFYVNDIYGRSANTIYLTVKGGVGTIDLKVAE